MPTIAEELEAELAAKSAAGTEEKVSVREYADAIGDLLVAASGARGVQASDHPARMASDEVNRLILEFTDAKGGNLTSLSKALIGQITYAGLRRRLRVARSGIKLGADGLRSNHGIKDPELIKQAAQEIRDSKGDGEEYRRVVKKWYEEGLNLQHLSRELGQSYYSLWALLRS